MGESMITDLGITCLVFWSMIGTLLTWHIWRIRKFNLGHDTSPKFGEKEHGTKPLLLETLKRNEAIYDVQYGTVLNNPEDPTHS